MKYFIKFRNLNIKNFQNNLKDMLNKINKDNKDNKNFQKFQNYFSNYHKHILLFTSVGASWLTYYFYNYYSNFISINQLDSIYLKNNEIKYIEIKTKNNMNFLEMIAHIKLLDGSDKFMKIGNIESFLNFLELKKLSYDSEFLPVYFKEKKISMFQKYDVLNDIISYLFHFAIMFSFMNLIKIQNKLNLSKNKKINFSKIKHNINFNKVAGLEEAKIEINEFVDFLKNPKRYHDMGAKIPKGALLTGPPGSGKTLLAKACSGESKVPFFYSSGSEFVEIFVGIGPQRVRNLFEEAKKEAPSVIFIDEIDAIGKKRSTNFGGNNETESTLNQLLVELDGFNDNNEVVVLAATNIPDSLDPALVRPGRFDRKIELTNPDIKARKEILKIHLKDLTINLEKTTKDEIAERMSSLTPGFSGAQLENLCNESAILAAREGSNFIELYHFEKSIERILGGYEKNKILNKKERERVAIHECGHAIVSWFLEGASPLLKLSIIPRSKGALGFAQYLPKEDGLETTEELLDKIISLLGGRAAEEIFLKTISTGAADDLEKAYNISRSMITKLGMNDKIGYWELKEVEQSNYKSFSNQTNHIIDQEIEKTISNSYKKAQDIWLDNEDKFIKLKDMLLEKESLNLKEIEGILGKRGFEDNGIKEYLNN